MSQHDFTISNQTFPAFRSDLNNALQALVSVSAGASAPTTTFAYQLWYDSTNDILKMRNAADDAWITLFTFNQGTNSVQVSGEEVVDDTTPQLGGDLDTNSNNINFADNDKAQFGAGNDLQIYHDGYDSYIQDAGTGDLIFKHNGNFARFETGGGTKTLEITNGGAVDLYHNGSKKLETTSSGVDVTGDADVSNRIYVGGASSALADINIVTDSSNGGIQLARKSSGFAASGEGLGSYGFKGTDSANSNAAADARIDAIASETHSGSTAATAMRFFTKSSGTGPGSAASERMRIDSSGRLLVNRTSASNNGLIELDYEPISARDKGIVLNNSNGTTGGQACNFLFSGTSVGNITTTASSTAYNTSSDYRLKENAVDMTGAITRVKSLQPKRFNFIVDTTDTLVDGFMAHEAATVVPEAVTGTHNEVETWTQAEIDAGDAPVNTNAGDNKLDDDGNTIPVYQGIDQAKLVPLLTGALQEAITKIETLETEMTALKARVTALESA